LEKSPKNIRRNRHRPGWLQPPAMVPLDASHALTTDHGRGRCRSSRGAAGVTRGRPIVDACTLAGPWQGTFETQPTVFPLRSPSEEGVSSEGTAVSSDRLLPWSGRHPRRGASVSR
jgi:hypothetical protein